MRSAGMIAERWSGYCAATASISVARSRGAAGISAPSPASRVGALAVHLAHHGVERADDRDHVGDERIAHTGRRRLEGDEGGRAELDAPRLPSPVRDDVAA